MARQRRRRRNTYRRRRRNPAISKKTKKMLLVGGLIGIGYYFWKKRRPALPDYEEPISIDVNGLSNYVTPSSVSGGMGFDVSRGADAFGSVQRADFAYDDTF